MLDTPFTTIAAVVVVFILAAVVVRVGSAILRKLLDRLEIVSAENQSAVHARARGLLRMLTMLAYGVAAAASVSVVLSRLGIEESIWNLRAMARWFMHHGVNLIVIVVGAVVVARAARLAIEHLQFKIGRSTRLSESDLERQRRAATLGGILTRAVTVAVAFLAVLMILRELAIDVTPILTGAGIAGLAIGFGAQNLVRDVISGFFLILEDQVRVGDLARINGVSGTVEQIGLRMIVLRDGAGAVQVFPNGTITALANLSKHFAMAVVDIQIAYTENIERVSDIMRQVGDSLERDPTWSKLVLEPLSIGGVQSLADGLATLRVMYKTLPLHQEQVANELRLRLMKALVARGVKPFSGWW
jgi:small conductance mechanosensitive channel